MVALNTQSKFSGRSCVIAVAGASGGVGQHVTEALIAAGFKVIVLLRKENPALISSFSTYIPDDALAGNFIAEIVDFQDMASLAAVFKKHGVDTVICAAYAEGDALVKIEENLLEAALQSDVRRFSPSCWAAPAEQTVAIRAYENRRTVLSKVKQANISWTHFTTGVFMNYRVGSPPLASDSHAQGHLTPYKFIVDVENGTAALQGAGATPLVFTEIHDVARAVAQACALQRVWEPKTGWMVGTRVSWAEVIAHAEEITGRKFKVTHLTPMEVEASAAPVGEDGGLRGYMQTFIGEALISMERGDYDHEDVLSMQIREEGLVWEPTDVKAFLEKWWGAGRI